MQTIPLRVEENGGTIPLGLEPVRVVDAVSPTAVVERVSDGVVLTVHDLNGTTTAEVHDGEQGEPGEPGKPGEPGAPGQPGVSPTISVTDITGGHRITITDATGSHAFDVMNGAPGEVPIDDNAGIGDTTKVWSADKSATEANQLLTAITAFEPPAYDATSTYAVGDIVWHSNKMYRCNTAISTAEEWTAAHWTEIILPKDVRVNGTSVVDAQGVANVPVATNANPGVVKVQGAYGFQMYSDSIAIGMANATEIKGGSNYYKPIVPASIHQAAFWGLAKASGDSTQSASFNAVGTYTDAAKIAIQKMLGIYQAPWELIREDTGTNATETDVDITVDGNGNAFELTDLYLMFWLPKQNNEAKKAGSGRFNFYYDNSDYCTAETGGYTQAANADSKGAQILIEQSKGAIKSSAIQFTSLASRGTVVGIYNNIVDRLNAVSFFSDTKYFNKVNITAVTGTWQYKLYGKRKWTV